MELSFVICCRNLAILPLAAAVFFIAVSAPAAIIVDGVDRGSTFVLSSSASTIFLTATNDSLTITDTNINGGLTLNAVDGSNVLLSGGRINGGFEFTGGSLTITENASIRGGFDLFAGTVSIDAQSDADIRGGIDVTGGGLFIDQLSNLSGNINISGNGVAFIGESVRNINGRLVVEDDAAVFFGADLAVNSGIDLDGRVSGTGGRITGLGNRFDFTTTADRNLFIAADRSDAEEAFENMTPAAVPEPTRALIALLGFSVALFARRRK